ncbi:hypothetical protein RKD23_001356 [Streptomyces sp. SAI-170]
MRAVALAAMVVTACTGPAPPADAPTRLTTRGKDGRLATVTRVRIEAAS